MNSDNRWAPKLCPTHFARALPGQDATIRDVRLDYSLEPKPRRYSIQIEYFDQSDAGGVVQAADNSGVGARRQVGFDG